MAEESGRPKPESDEALTGIGEIPPLMIERDRLTFYAAGRAVHIPLELLMNQGNAGAVGLLLYATVLKLREIDRSLRRIAEVAETQQQRVAEMTGGGAQRIVSDVVEGLQRMGVFPQPPSGEARPGDDASAQVRFRGPGNRGLA